MARLPKGITKQPNGLYQLRFVFDGKRYAVYGKSVAEVREKEVEKRMRLKEGLLDNKNITLARFYDDWQQGRHGIVKESTIYTQNGRFEYVRHTLGKKRLQKIEKRDIIQAQRDLSERLSTQTVNNIIALLSSVLQVAYNDRIINWNPASGVKSLKRSEPDATKTIHRALTEAEQKRFFTFAQGTYYYNFFRFLLMTGCRTGEAAALTYSDIDRKNNIININKTVSRTGNGTFEVGTPKTRSSVRTIPLTPELIEVIEDQKQIQAALGIVPFDGRIFTTTNGTGYICVTSLAPCIKAILRKANEDAAEPIEYFSPHAFRDTFATRCIEQGMTPHTLKALLGHSKLSMTMDRYAQTLEDTKQRERDKIRFVI